MSTKSLNTAQAAAEITRTNETWGQGIGEAATVTYGFRATAGGLDPNLMDTFDRFGASEIRDVERALSLWSDVANIKFVRVGSGTVGEAAYTNDATMLFGAFGNVYEAPAFSNANPNPNRIGAQFNNGDVWLNRSWSAGNLNTFIHEIGHSIGLSHPGIYDTGDDSVTTVNGAGPVLSYAGSSGYVQDTQQYSIMSYWAASNTGANHGNHYDGYTYGATPLLHDIAAAQRLYGANMSTRTGDTTYGFNSTAGQWSFNIGSVDDKVVFAIWDAGGTDTLDLSGYKASQLIDLTPGAFSDAGGLTKNIAIAEGAYIENAIGGYGDDKIIGNGLRNALYGGDGNDTLDGRLGADAMFGGAGNDVYIVDNVGDVVSEFGTSGSGFSASSGDMGIDEVRTTLAKYTLPSDLMSNIENLTFIGPGAFQGAGNSLNNVIKGRNGNDTLSGGDGDDTLDGGVGADLMVGGRGNDTYIVDNVGDFVSEFRSSGSGISASSGDAGGIDTVRTTLAKYTLPNDFGSKIENLTFIGSGDFDGTGNSLNNFITGGNGNDFLSGGAGNDTLEGSVGADVMYGGAGDDTYRVDNVNDVVNEQIHIRPTLGALAAKPYQDAGSLHDTVITSLNKYDLSHTSTGALPGTLFGVVENLTYDGSGQFTGIGNGVDNIIQGNRGNDNLYGGAGNDSLYGGGGSDTLVGGAGRDLMDGGEDGDTFIADNGDKVGGDVILGGTGKDTVVANVNVAATGLRLNLFAQGTALTAAVSLVANTSAAIDVEIVQGGTGNDIIDAHRLGVGEGVRLEGNDGLDTLIGGVGADWLDGGANADRLVGGDGRDIMDGGDGDDVLVADNGDVYGGESVIGGQGYDQVLADTSVAANGFHMTILDQALAPEDAKILLATSSLATGVEDVQGGTGADVLDASRLGKLTDIKLEGNAGADILTGGAANDTLIGGAGADQLYGGKGDDTLVVDNADMNVNGGDGFDYVKADASTATEGFHFNVAGTSIESVDGSRGHDLIDASGSIVGDFVDFYGGAGNDTMIGGAGEEWFTGGEGLDIIVFSGNFADYTFLPGASDWTDWTMIIDKATGVADWTIGVEKLVFADQTIDDPFAKSRIIGTSGADTLIGTDGADVLVGGGGADVMHGGAGYDALYIDNATKVVDGGEGWDVVYVNEIANQTGLSFKMAGTNTEFVWSGMGNDTIDTRGLEAKGAFYYGVNSNAGDDMVIAGDASLEFIGGAGQDTLVLSGNQSDYSFSEGPAATNWPQLYTITNTTTGVAYAISSVETITFADASINYHNLFV